MKKSKYLIYLLWGCIILNACSNNDQQNFHEDSNISLVSLSKSSKGDKKIKIKRIDNSFYTKNKELLASFYYDKLVFKSKNKELEKKINDFFDQDIKEWNQGANRFNYFYENNSYQGKTEKEKLEEGIQFILKNYGQDSLLEQPLNTSVDTTIPYVNENYLSVLQVYRSNIGGPTTLLYFGTTFNLITGEVVPLTNFIEIDAVDFKKIVLSYFEKLKAQNQLEIDLSEIYAIYEYKQNKSFESTIGRIPLQLDYEYYYDGANINIILNFGFSGSNASILQWNGKIGAESKIKLIAT